MPKLYSGSPWQQFKQKWSDCSACKLCEIRKNIVLCRGNIPCDVLFIGEAPGASEDALGEPFVGPAGKLLDQQIEDAIQNCRHLRNRNWDDLRFCFTNLVCCIPKESNGGRKIGEPSKESIKACEPRLVEFRKLCNPKLIVAVGDLANKSLAMLIGNEFYVSITHPAAILRAEVVRQELMYQKVVVVLENAFADL